MIKEQFAFLLNVVKLILKAEELGFVVTGGELYRTPEQQTIYYNTGRSKTMNSMHLQRLAIDLNFFDKNSKQINSVTTLAPLGAYWESLDSKNKWGGGFPVFKDVYHFERTI